MCSGFLEQKNLKMAKTWGEHSNNKISEKASVSQHNDQ